MPFQPDWNMINKPSVEGNLVQESYFAIKKRTLEKSYLELVKGFLKTSSKCQAMIELDSAIRQTDGQHLIGYTVFITDVSTERISNVSNLAFTITFTPVFIEGRGHSGFLVEFDKHGKIQRIRQISTQDKECGRFYPDNSSSKHEEFGVVRAYKLLNRLQQSGRIVGPIDHQWLDFGPTGRSL